MFSNLIYLLILNILGRFKPAHPNDDFSQPGALFRKVMQDQDKTNTVSNIVGHLKGANRDIQERQVRIFYKCDAEYGSRIATALGFPANRSNLWERIKDKNVRCFVEHKQIFFI